MKIHKSYNRPFCKWTTALVGMYKGTKSIEMNTDHNKLKELS